MRSWHQKTREECTGLLRWMRVAFVRRHGLRISHDELVQHCNTKPPSLTHHHAARAQGGNRRKSKRRKGVTWPIELTSSIDGQLRQRPCVPTVAAGTADVAGQRRIVGDGSIRAVERAAEYHAHHELVPRQLQHGCVVLDPSPLTLAIEIRQASQRLHTRPQLLLSGAGGQEEVEFGLQPRNDARHESATVPLHVAHVQPQVHCCCRLRYRCRALCWLQRPHLSAKNVHLCLRPHRLHRRR